MHKDRIIRLPEVLERVSLSRTTIYQKIQEGSFPKQLKLGRASGWLESEIDAWIEKLANSRR
jgi:prophage regulatory protein